MFFREMRDVFKLMNHNDSLQSFKREIKMFDRIIVSLTELYQNGGQMPRSFNLINQNSAQSDKEGGNVEMMQQKLELIEKYRPSSQLKNSSQPSS